MSKTAVDMSVRFEPPAHYAYRRSETLQTFASVLRGRPREWALLGGFPTAGAARQAAYQVRTALRLKDQIFAPARSFEAEARTLLGEHRVYVRFVGGDAA